MEESQTLSALPDNTLLQILRCLPFQDQVRTGRVDTNFRRISRIAVSKNKSLELGCDSGRLESISPRSLKAIFDLCAGNLENLSLRRSYNTIALFNTVAAFSFARLTELDVTVSRDRGDDADLDQILKDAFARLIRNSPNLRFVSWNTRGYSAPVFPDGLYPNLERLVIVPCNDDTLRSMTGRLPNLKCIKSDFFCNKSLPIFDDFLRSVPKMEHLRVSVVEYRRLVNFWNLHFLTELALGSHYHRISDDDLKKIAASFPRLQNLTVAHTPSTSAAGVAALASLSHLRELTVWHFSRITPNSDVDVAFRSLSAACTHLEWISAQFAITPITLLSFIRFCPRLRFFKIARILDIDKPDAVVAVLRSLIGAGNKHVITEVRFFGYQTISDIWLLDPVKAVLKELAEDGVVIVNNE